MMVPVCDICGANLFSPQQPLSSLSCGHVYHSTCIKLHVSQRYDCKVCHCPASVSSIFQVKISSQKTASNSDQNREEKDSIVLDVLQTRTDDVVKENHELKKEIERLKHEIDSDSTLFNMKVVELQNKFYQVEEQIRLKDREIERLRGMGDCNQSIATETEILEDTLRSGFNTGGAGVCNSGIYTSLDAKYPQKTAPITVQVTSCLRQFLMIIVFVAIILLITIVIPLKIAFTP